MKKIFKSRSCIVIVVIIAISLAVSSAGCSGGYSWESVTDGESLVQVSTLDALLNGVYDGVMDFKTLKEYGDFGIGTFDKLDGEMIGYDGRFYQIRADGKAYPVAGTMTTSFASVTFFDSDYEIELEAGMDYGELQEYLDGILSTINVFYAVKIEGIFTGMRTRSVPAQEKPYPPLAEVTENQPEFEFSEVSGVIAGFRSPSYMSTINVPGYHLHLLTEDKDAGGHILDFKIKEATAYIDETQQFMMILPDPGSDFYKVDLSQYEQTDLEGIEN